jgi:RNA polymerase sigma-70 factor (ECF subfamily)
MADLSEQQVMMADVLASGRQDGVDRQKGQVREFVDALFQHVSEEDRMLLTLKEVEGLSLKELEEIYRVKENAIKVRLFRARQRVLKAYKKATADGNL